MLKQSQKKSIVELSIYLSFLIVTLIFVQRLLDGGVLYFDDGFFPFNPQLSFIQNISSWDSPFFPGGSYYGNFYYIPLIVAIWFFRDLGLTFSESESFYLAINLFTGAVGTYLLSKYIFRHYVIKQESNSLYALAGPAAASFYYIFNYQQMTYYGGEFYQGFILINFTPLFIYVVMRYLSTPVKFGVWNRFLAAISLTSLVISGGLAGVDSVGTDVFWFFIILFVSILLARFLKSDIINYKHFYIKSLAVFSVTVLSIAWTVQAIYYGSIQAYSYATTTIYGGVKIITEPGPNMLLNLKSFITSGFYLVNSSFGVAGSNRIWYAPEEFVHIHPYLSIFLYAPFVISFIYVPFIGRKWLEGRNILFLLLATIIFYFTVTFIVSKNYLLLPGNLIFSGINFALSPLYSLYPSVIITSISLAISIDILAVFLDKKVYFSHIRHPLSGGYVQDNRRNNQPVPINIVRQKREKNHIKLTVNLTKGRPSDRRVSPLFSIFVIATALLLFIMPVFSNPLEYWQYDSNNPISGSFQVNNDFVKTGEFLSALSPYGNVLYLPVTVSPNAASQGNSSYMIVSPPFSPFFGGEMINEDPGPVNSTFAYPIMKYFPGNSTDNISNFLSLLGIDYIIVNTAEYPTWVSAPPNQFSGGGPPWNYSLILHTLNESKGIRFVTSFGPYYIYDVENSLPPIYPTYALSPAVYGSPSPTRIFDLYASGILEAGKFSIINSTLAMKVPPSALRNMSLNLTINPNLVVNRISNTEYVANVKANSSFFIVFNQAFDTHWVANINGKIISEHFEANGFANSWLLPKGNYTVKIYFAPQKTQNLLNLITIIATTIATLALAFDTVYQLSGRKRSQGTGGTR